MSAEKVLIVDDDNFVQKVLAKALLERYETRSAANGNDGSEVAREWQPDVILLDVEMPGRNGYEVCDQLKRDEATRDIPVVFLSSKSSLRERMLGYEVGGDDYIVKPCEPAELNAKITRIIARAKEKQNLLKTAESAQQTAMEAMTTGFELGKAVRFVERSYGAADVASLASMLIEFCRDLQLSSALMFLTRSGHVYFSSSGKEVSPLETEILDMLHKNERFVDFGCRTQVNYTQVSLLIKNMPLEDRPRYGRIKDILPFVLGAADAKVRVLDAETALLNQTAELTASVDVVSMTLATMRETFASNLNAVSTIMSELIATLSIDLQNLGLENDQESWVCDKVEGASKSVYACVEENSKLERNLSEIVSLLKRVTDEQNKIISENLSQKPEIVEDNSTDIELF